MKAMQAYFEIYREFDRKISYITNKNDNCDAHFHSNIEILHVVSGCVDMTIRGVTRRLHAGDTAIASSYEPHAFVTVSESVVNVFLFPSDMVPDFTSRTDEYSFKDSFMEKNPRTPELLDAMTHLIPYADKEVTLVATGYMYTVLGILTEELGLDRKNETRQSELLIRKLLVYIEEHFKEPISLSMMAHSFGYHKDYLSRVFNSRIGCSFSRYVNVLRARHARYLIRTTRKSLDEISVASGFRCMKSFRRAFFDYYGQTPYEYRCETGEKT